MVFRLPKMSEEEIERLIREQTFCRIAFKGSKHPYIAPFQYAFIDGALYFHFTKYGKKINLLEKDRRVCVEIEKFKPDLSEYSFVVMRGSLESVRNPEERSRAIRKMAEDGKQKLSENFLAAHGFSRQDGWAALSPEKRLEIIKLADVTETIGLKSPEMSMIS